METIIASLISASVTLVVCVISNSIQAQKIQSLLEYRMGILERKQDEYNNVIRRVFKLEERTSVQDQQISSLAGAIDDLKNAD